MERGEGWENKNENNWNSYIRKFWYDLYKHSQCHEGSRRSSHIGSTIRYEEEMKKADIMLVVVVGRLVGGNEVGLNNFRGLMIPTKCWHVHGTAKYIQQQFK